MENSMNFDYIKDAEPATEDLKQLYDALYRNLEKAEELYWTRPQRCGMMRHDAAQGDRKNMPYL